MINIEKLSKAIYVLSKKNFTAEIEDGTEIHLSFKPSNFYHLIGLQHLTDIPAVINAKNKGGLVKQLLKDDKLVKQVEKSAFFNSIRPRIETIDKLVEMLVSDRCEIIIDFDATILEATKLRSKYLLYKSEDNTTYFMLGIAQNQEGIYYPETYIVEPSKYYVSKQKILNCIISYEEFNSKAAYRRKVAKH